MRNDLDFYTSTDTGTANTIFLFCYGLSMPLYLIYNKIEVIIKNLRSNSFGKKISIKYLVAVGSLLAGIM